MVHITANVLFVLVVLGACYVHAYVPPPLQRGIRCEHAKKDTLDIRCPKGTTIDISYANYGRTSVDVPCPLNKKDITKCIEPKSEYIVKHLCQGKSACWIKASNYVFGDPCFGVEKYVEIAWICNACKPKNPCQNGGECNPVKNSYRCKCKPGFGGTNCEKRIACEDRRFNIVCPTGTVIRVKSANYGRTTLNVPCPINRPDVEKCIEPQTLYLVKHQCEGKHFCWLKAASYVFGDPCEGVTKFLEIDWTCVNVVQKSVVDLKLSTSANLKDGKCKVK